MTAVAIETSVLAALDFEISCQAVAVRRFFGEEMPADECNRPATHVATIHKVTSCEWVEKFLCATHSVVYVDPCWGCGLAPRMRDCKPLGATQ